MVKSKNTLKLLSLLLATLTLFSCLSLSALAADEIQEPEYGKLLETVEYLFGDAAVVDGRIDFGEVIHSIVYKDSPAITDMLNLMYDFFWEVVMFFVNLFT